MKIESTKFRDVFIGTPRKFGDERGYFMESFNVKAWEGKIPSTSFVQDNESYSSYGVLRGLHFQRPPFAQAKLVRVIKGKVIDTILDLRKGEPTYGQTLSIELTEENCKQFYVPRGFAHGFVVLSETALFAYKCDNYYSKEHDSGIHALDKTLNIDWGIPSIELQLSDKDLIQPKWGDHYIFNPNELY